MRIRARGHLRWDCHPHSEKSRLASPPPRPAPYSTLSSAEGLCRSFQTPRQDRHTKALVFALAALRKPRRRRVHADTSPSPR